MFLKAILICGALISAFNVSTAALRWIPSPPIVTGLIRCHETWCFGDIQPGTTRWTEARQIFSNTPGFTLTPFREARIERGPVRVVRAVTNQAGIVSQLNLIFEKPSLTVGDITAAMGYPCQIYRVGIATRQDSLILAWADAAVWVPTRNRSITPQSLVSRIDIGTSAIMVGQTHPKCWVLENAARYRWTGFRRY
jgi:hypothetical protein